MTDKYNLSTECDDTLLSHNNNDDQIISCVQFDKGYIDNDEVSEFLFRIQNKYSGDTERKHLRQLYDIGLKISNRNFNREKLIIMLTKLIDRGSYDKIHKVREYKRKKLLEAFMKGVDNGLNKTQQYC